MRLIDADTLIALLNKKYGSNENVNESVLYLVGAISGATTVDAEPVRHGHWTDRAKSILGLPTEACSECAEWSVGHNKNYCPNCGAKMDEVMK